MAVIEGHAEHVMDAAGGESRPVERLRAEWRHGARAAARWTSIVARLLGLDLKLRQYEPGKAFCDEVVAEAGVDGLNRVWSSPDALPALASWRARPRGSSAFPTAPAAGRIAERALAAL